MKKIKSFLITATLFVPAIVLAAEPENLGDLIGIFQGLIELLVPLVMSLAVLAFLWGLVNYIFHGGNEQKRKEGYQFMVYGVIALFVMVSLWGLVSILYNTIFGGGSGVGISGDGGRLPSFPAPF